MAAIVRRLEACGNDHHAVARMGRRLALYPMLAMLLVCPALAPAQVRWRGNTQAAPAKEPQEALAWLAQPASMRGRHVLVRFDGVLSAAERAALEAAGLELGAYLGDHAYFAVLADEGLAATSGPAAARLRDAGAIRPDHRLSPVLAGMSAPAWLRIAAPPGEANNPQEPWVPVYVLFHADVGPEEIEALVRHHRLVVRGGLRTVNALVVEAPYSAIAGLATEDAVQYIEPALPALDEVNDSNRAATQADVVQALPYGLDGSGVSVMVYDAGTARATHVDFEGRLAARDASGVIDHATHVAGTIGGAGVGNLLLRGMAPGVLLESYGYEQVGGLHQGFLYTDPGDIEADYADAIAAHGADLANNSIGTNTAANGFPCEWEGDYGVTDAVIDAIVRGGLGAPFRIVWANGNERSNGRCGTGYHTTAPPACAKNHISVGALNSNDDTITYFTSWGPADDGRLKPDISAPGCQIGGDGGVSSCSAASDTAYTTFCGTSMAAPTVTGLAALLLQDFRQLFPSRPDPRNSTLKALLVQTARDIGPLGPDYQTGYGLVQAQQAVDFLRTKSFFEGELAQGGVSRSLVAVNAGAPALRVTLAWDDAPAAPNVIPALVNDLDLVVRAPSGGQWYPWTLGGLADPAAPAVRTLADHVNNLEQVLVDVPAAGVWTIEVHGFNVPQGPQPFSLCITPTYSPDCNTNGVDDLLDISAGTSADCDSNQVPDECEPVADCNSNGAQDTCDIAAALSADVNLNRIPDECEPDCNANLIPDEYEVRTGASADCNANLVPDACDLAAGVSTDCAGNGIPDECEPDCNQNSVPDDCDLANGSSVDCDQDAVPDECEGDCNGNGVADACDIASGFSLDANLNGYPDECARIFVSAAAAGIPTGWSWDQAYRDLSTALAQARANVDVREIWVAAGQYAPAGPGGDRAAAFELVDGVRLLGGFAGSERRAEQRDPATFETILSGDLNGDDAPAWGNRQDNSLHVLVGQSLGGDAVLDGFTVTGGYGSSNGGAGLLLSLSRLHVIRCRFVENLAGFSHGGAVELQDSYARFEACTFERNYVHLGKGGAIHLAGDASAELSLCRFADNTSVGSTSGSPEAAGAAIAHWASGGVWLSDCRFERNVSRGFYAGGTNGAYAGAIDHFGPGPLTVDRCVFLDNSSNAGGAIFSWRDATISNSVFAGNRAPQFNSTNGWGGQGGALAFQSYAGSTVALVNCVFYGNTAEDAGGVGAYGAAHVSLANSILWANADNRGSVGASQVSGGSLSHCCIMNMLVAAPGDDPPDPARFPGCTAADPLFVDAAADDFHLAEGSSAIDAGRNDRVLFGVLRDLDRRFRFLDDPLTPDGGLGAAPLVDMGAFERGEVAGVDFNADGSVDLFDYGILHECLGGPGQVFPGDYCAPFDRDGDGDVDLLDAAGFASAFTGRPALDPPALIQGAVSYGGAEVGTLHVRARGIGTTSAGYEVTLAAPGPYALALDLAGTYEVSAFLDTNSNGQPDATDPAAVYTGNPIDVTASGQVHGGVNLSLGGAHRISGRIEWDAGGPAWNVTVALGGTAAATTTTDENGTYHFDGLDDGSYAVTPSGATRYFYPYERAVQLAGADAAGIDFVMHALPGGDVNGEATGVVLAVDAAGYNLTLDTGDGPLLLYVYAGTVFSGDAAGLAEIGVGWEVTAQYYASTGLAVEVDSMSGGF